MDTITHGLLGAAIAAAVAPNADSRRRLAIFGAIVAASPDCDLFLQTWLRHRAETHSFFYQTIASPVIAGLASVFFSRAPKLSSAEKSPKKSASDSTNVKNASVADEEKSAAPPTSTPSPKPRCGFWYLAFIALICLFSHSILDLCTSWGTRVFLPFSDRIDAFDIIAIVDGFFSVPLLLLMLFLLFNPRRFARAQKVAAVIVLAWCGLYLASGAALGWRVKNVPDLRVDGGNGVVRASPLNGSIFIWRAAKVANDSATVVYVDALRGRVVWRDQIPVEDTVRTRALLQSPLMSEWIARSHGVFTITENDVGEVDFCDLRYGSLSAPKQVFFTIRGAFDDGGNLISITQRRAAVRRTFTIGAMLAEFKSAWQILRGATIADLTPNQISK